MKKKDKEEQRLMALLRRTWEFWGRRECWGSGLGGASARRWWEKWHTSIACCLVRVPVQRTAAECQGGWQMLWGDQQNAKEEHHQHASYHGVLTTQRMRSSTMVAVIVDRMMILIIIMMGCPPLLHKDGDLKSRRQRRNSNMMVDGRPCGTLWCRNNVRCWPSLMVTFSMMPTPSRNLVSWSRREHGKMIILL